VFQEGDFVEIPLPDGRTAIAQILVISNYFKNMVGFLVFGIKGDVDSSRDTDESAAPGLGPLYTNINAAKDYGWTTVGNRPLTEEDRLRTKVLVGGAVFIGDKWIGSVNSREAHELGLKTLLASGMPVVYKDIERAFGASSPDMPKP
jgi:hypothetical protein